MTMFPSGDTCGSDIRPIASITSGEKTPSLISIFPPASMRARAVFFSFMLSIHFSDVPVRTSMNARTIMARSSAEHDFLTRLRFLFIICCRFDFCLPVSPRIFPVPCEAAGQSVPASFPALSLLSPAPASAAPSPGWCPGMQI